jgi:hypothetical protein
VFEDCAHWWALAHHCLVALDEIHSLELVHLDVKGDNICIPIGPREFDHAAEGQRMFPVFRKLALIDFAFSLVSGETLPTALPIGWQKDYDYQSPRLLHALEAGRHGDLEPTEALDWRCDMYSLAAMLKRYLPGEERLYEPGQWHGWTATRHAAAKSLILRIREAHDRDPASRRPHADFLNHTSAQLCDAELVESLERGWMLARDAQTIMAPVTPLTPITRLAPPIRIVVPPRESTVVASASMALPERPRLSRTRHVLLAAAAVVVAAIGVFTVNEDAATWLGTASQRVVENGRTLAASLRDRLTPSSPQVAAAASDPDATESTSPQVDEAIEPPAPESEQRAVTPAPKAERPQPPVAQTHSSLPEGTRRKDSSAAQIEVHRTKPVPRASRASRADAQAAAREGPARSPAASQRTTAQAPRAATARAPVPKSVTVSRVAPASRRERSTPSVAIPIASASVAPPAVVVPTAPANDPIARFAMSPGPDASEPSAPPATSNSTPPVTVAPRAEASVPVAPAEAPPAIARTNPVPPGAPIVEKSRPVATPALPAPRIAPPAVIAETPRGLPEPAQIDPDAAYLARAKQLLEDVVPHTSAQVHARVARVLRISADVPNVLQQRAILVAASGIAAGTPLVLNDLSPGEGRRLHTAARNAYQLRHHIPEAFDLALKAFGANPNDPEIAGHLAFLHLKVVPHQPERARQLALHALGLRKEPYPATRFDDWTTFAVASALTGRTPDAANALAAALVLARDTDRVCRSMLGALASYGERLRQPVEAMLDRLQVLGRADEFAYCGWLSGRMARARYQ